jgi:hypothetical protein
MKSTHGSWAEVGYCLARFFCTSYPQPVDPHPFLVDLETINLLKPPKMLQQVEAACMKQKNCTIILKVNAGKVKKLIKKSCLLHIPSWNLSICIGNVWNRKVVRNVHNDKVHANRVIGNSIE